MNPQPFGKCENTGTKRDCRGMPNCMEDILVQLDIYYYRYERMATSSCGGTPGSGSSPARSDCESRVRL